MNERAVNTFLTELDGSAVSLSLLCLEGPNPEEENRPDRLEAAIPKEADMPD